jgi:hypothetical protein
MLKVPETTRLVLEAAAAGAKLPWLEQEQPWPRLRLSEVQTGRSFSPGVSFHLT